jgi:hypothetical protein
MASVRQIASPDAIRRIQRVQTVTNAWMSVETVVSLFAAWRVHSPALLAFGGDSAINLARQMGQTQLRLLPFCLSSFGDREALRGKRCGCC